jgi:acyl-CoA dehydrogenase
MAPDPVPELGELVAGVRAFLRAEVEPRQAKLLAAHGGRHRIYTDEGRFTPEVLDALREVREASARAGYYTMLAPASIGGGGLGFTALFAVWEAIYHECGAELWLGYHAVGHWSRGPSHLLAFASDRVRDEVLPGLLAGTNTLCFAMSEPDAGSDAWRMRTRATRTDGGWVLSGTKQWITNAPYADHVIVFAVTDPDGAARRKGGISGFIVPMDGPGVCVDSVIEMFGHPGGDEGIISFQDVFVAADRVVGQVGDGMRLAVSGVSAGRLYNTARSVGLAQWALDKALDYAEQREAFGQPIIENQGVSFPLADSAMEVHAARLVGRDCATALDAGGDCRLQLSMAKAYATEMAVRVVDRAIQAHGAMGFTNEVGLAEAWQQVRRICVADGSAEIMRREIVRQLRRSRAR